MLPREVVRQLALKSKDHLGLTWQNVAEAIGRSHVYAASLAYGYGQATEEEATKLDRVLELSEEAQWILQKAPHRSPADPWPPTDPFVYRLYELVMLYGSVFKDIAQERSLPNALSDHCIFVDLCFRRPLDSLRRIGRSLERLS